MVYRDGLKGEPVMLSNSQAGPGRKLSQPGAHLIVHFCTYMGTLAGIHTNLCEDCVGGDENRGGDPEDDAGLGRGEESDVGGEEQLLVHSQP